ncbi:MAG TPA: type I-C CRISPR-associated endonuclease Cas1c [Clostridia bacterium]
MKRLLNVLYITLPDVYIFLENENVCVKKDNEIIFRAPLLNLENIICFNYPGVTSHLMGECAKRNITITFLNEYGKFIGSFYGPSKGNVLLRKEQYRISEQDHKSIRYAKNFIFGKIHNQKWVIERAIRDHFLRVNEQKLKAVSVELTEDMKQTINVQEKDELRAIEGKAAQSYFKILDDLILQNKDCFVFDKRIRRPPTDPVNALMSFAYSLLAIECKHALESVGLDSYVGFFHVDRPARPSLALDLMEELRPHFADRFVLSLINRKEVLPEDFERQESGAVLLKDDARKKFLSAWQDRKKETIIHPFLNEKIEWGLVPYVQALLLARTIRQDLDEYPCFLWK